MFLILTNFEFARVCLHDVNLGETGGYVCGGRGVSGSLQQVGTKRCGRSQLPVDGWAAGRAEDVVDLAEVAAAEEASRRRKGRGVRRFEHRVALGVDGAALVRGGLAPQQEHQSAAARVELRDDGVGKLLPTPLLMRVGLCLPHSEHRVEHEDALLRPPRQAAVRRPLEGDLGVLLQLFVHVQEAGRRGDPALNAKGESVCLARAVVRVLAHNDDRDGVERAKVKGAEDLGDGREDRFRAGQLRAVATQVSRKAGGPKMHIPTSRIRSAT